MKYTLKGLLIVLVAISIFSCKEDDPSIQISYEDIELAFQEFEIKPGIQDLNLQITEGLSYDFRVIFPDVDLTNDVPLILTLHGALDGDPLAHTYTDCYVEEGFSSLNGIILSPNGGLENWGNFNNSDMLRILTDLSSRYWPVDTDKIVITGYSSGGNGSWAYAETQPDFFSAAIPIASGYNPFRPDGTIRSIDIPLYVIHGANDELFPIDTIEYWVNEGIDAGNDITFVKIDSLGHYEGCEYTPYVQAAATWLLDEVW